MHEQTRKISGKWSVWGSTVVLALCAAAVAQNPDGPPTVRSGRIAAKDVYVRSGDSLNHYTICKLNVGDTVRVVSERGEWYEILPPEGTFSLVSGDFIDTTDNQTGTVNGDNVRVRAGSTLNENKYTVQTLLKKGTSVSILGRNPDGFVRIKPPEGATVWINRSYVSVDGEAPVRPQGTPSAASGAETASAEPSAPPLLGAPVVPSKSFDSPASRASLGTGDWRRKLEENDEAAHKEFEKPVAQRRFDAIVSKYKTIAAQTEDSFSREYAQARLQQIEDFAALTDAIAKVNALDEQAEARRNDYLAGRNRIPEPEPINPPTGIEVQGILKVSALYPPGSANPRYRLVDPNDPGDRTIGYVEFAPDANVNVEPFLGRAVGVRATGQRIQQGGVKPVPIYVARELILVETVRSAQGDLTSPH